MIQAILDALYYCCFREKYKISTETVIEHLERLTENEVKFIINKVIKNRDLFKSCC
jgi:hypothetical protein